MRVRVEAPPGPLVPDVPVPLAVEVTNGLTVIDGVRAVVHADPRIDWEAEPELLPLFPDGSGSITLTLTADPSLPAGEYQVPVELQSAAAPATSATRLLALSVSPAPAMTVAAEPSDRTGRHRVSHEVVVANTGNTTLDVDLGATDTDRALTCHFTPPTLRIEPGRTVTSRLELRGRRRLFGTEVAHKARVVAAAPDAQAETTVTFRQRPMVPRGARTVALLAAIVAVWATVMVVALVHALGASPLQKTVPASFYAGDSAAASAALAVSRTPAGAVPKSGLVVGVGGTLAGTVVAASTGQGIGRITVQAYGVGPGGTSVLDASAASAADGSWSIPGLFPGAYRIELSAQGFETEWYPAAPSERAAEVVHVHGLQTTSGLRTVVTGLPGSITGTVDTGQNPPPTVTVTVLPEQASAASVATGTAEAQAGATSPTPVATVTTNAQGTYSVTGLATPGTYDLSFSAPGYQAGTDTEVLAGGQQDIANTVTLTAADGSISGTVTGESGPLGGVTITASANGNTYTTATPTSGQVGVFTLGNLPSPATYLLTFTASGYGAESIAQQLGPGQSLTGLAVAMAGGAGDVSGTVEAADGTPLGGVTVTVSGTTQPVTTQTLTAGQVGSYQITGLPTPGQFTLTFSLAGYLSETIPVDLASSGSAGGVDATLAPADGAISGTVVSGGTALSGATVSVTDGGTPLTTTSTSQPPGGFSLSGLPPGQYSVTVSLTGYQTTTVQVAVTAGQTAQPEVQMAADSSGGSGSSGSGS